MYAKEISGFEQSKSLFFQQFTQHGYLNLQPTIADLAN